MHGTDPAEVRDPGAVNADARADSMDDWRAGRIVRDGHVSHLRTAAVYVSSGLRR
jgi:hypothetical protein